ncbi:MAG: hypothetical protein HYY07_00275, partial [Elusimicrobia bacterium]|nr:hypothetical protein [Elusimicrobiota bacterium]
IQRVVIIFNESENECVDWARQNFKRLQLEFIVKSTRSSYESFVLVGKKCGEGRHLMMTSDSICEAEEFRKMVSCGKEGSQDIYLGVTQTVFDEKPLWVTMEPKSNQITRLSGESGNCVTAGFYNVPSEIFSLTPETEIASLRFFLSWLKEKNFSMVAVPMQNVFDVDDPNDIEMAEKILK